MRIRTDRLKPIFCLNFVFTACVISIFLFTNQTWGQTPDADKPKPKRTPAAEEPFAFSGTIEVGLQARWIQGSHTAKFQEIRAVPEGFTIQRLNLEGGSPDSPYSFRFRGYEIRETDQRFTVYGSRVGKFRTKFMWDQIPHRFGTGQSFLQETSPGLYQVSPTLRARLQALTTPEARILPNALLPTVVRQELQTAPLTEVRLRRDQAVFTGSYQATDNIELYTRFSWLRNRGSRPMSAGTFVRRAVPANGLADIGGMWEGIGQEFPEPINHRTTDLRIGVKFSGENWSAGAYYDLSLFRNPIESLIFENPFRITDEEGCLPNAANPAAPTCGASNRFRMVRWQQELPPNNDSHTITVWGKWDPTKHTQVRGIFSLAVLKQNDPFLPYTLNTAIVPQHWNATSPVTNPTDVNQLPASSANAKMRNINQEYALVNSRQKFRFFTEYRSQSVDNRTPTIEFPGYAAFGDSTWRSATTDFYNLPIENLDWDFRRQNSKAGFDWDILPDLTWKFEYGWEGWNRKFRDVNRNNEHSFRNRLDLLFNLSGKSKGSTPTHAGPPKSVTTLGFKLDYRFSNRRAQAYNSQDLTYVPNIDGTPAGGPTDGWIVTRTTVMKVGVPMEFNLLRRYDEMDRVRHDAMFTVELLKGPNTRFSASYRYLGDSHTPGFYGRLFNRSSYIDAEFSHTFENGSYLFVNYSRDTNKFAYRDVAHLLPNPPAPPGTIVQGTLSQYPIANTWERTSDSSLDSFEFGVNVAPLEGKFQNWQLDLSYAFSGARERITTVNPYTVRPDSLLHAGAFPYPDTVIRRQYVNLAVTRRINEKYEVGFRYWYEPYIQDDFSYNIMAPYVHGFATSDTPKYLFQDARYASYHANVASVFLRYSF
jgi:hypothetical protein